jgi:coenzyme F420-0:L-glutamate ligase/coenzyme F420-1:gamma-L-glutamate ligase
MPALWDQRGRTDLFGRPLQITVTALGDQIAAAADLVAGQAGEGRPVVHVRGLSFPPADGRSSDLVRPRDQDLYS